MDLKPFYEDSLVPQTEPETKNGVEKMQSSAQRKAHEVNKAPSN